jgi:hypothetical protein
MNAEVPKLSGDEILEAINQAGLKKRQTQGLEPQQDSNSVSPNAGSEAYADGGNVDQPDEQWDRLKFGTGRLYNRIDQSGQPKYDGSVIYGGESLRSDPTKGGESELESKAKRFNSAPRRKMAGGGRVYAHAGLGA